MKSHRDIVLSKKPTWHRLKGNPVLWKSLQRWISWFIICPAGKRRAPSQLPCTRLNKKRVCAPKHTLKRKYVQIRGRSYSGTEKDSHAGWVANRCRYHIWEHNAHQFHEKMVGEKKNYLTCFRNKTLQTAVMDKRLFFLPYLLFYLFFFKHNH